MVESKTWQGCRVSRVLSSGLAAWDVPNLSLSSPLFFCSLQVLRGCCPAAHQPLEVLQPQSPPAGEDPAIGLHLF